MNTLLNKIKRLQLIVNHARYCSYKAVKRPSLNAVGNKAFVDKKMAEYDLPKILKSKIESTGPITGKLTLFLISLITILSID
jgi:hypothetical protein